MDKLENIIANNLIYLRKKADLTQFDFGQKFNYSDKTVSKWEQGTVIPSVETLVEIASFYGVSLDYITTEHKNKKEYESVIKKNVNSRNKILLMILSAVIVLCIASTTYVASIYNIGTADPNINHWWCIFLWALPISAFITAYQAHRYFHSVKATLTLLSIGLWALLLSAFFTFLYKNVYWYIFIIGIPVQIAFILLEQINKGK